MVPVSYSLSLKAHIKNLTKCLMKYQWITKVSKAVLYYTHSTKKKIGDGNLFLRIYSRKPTSWHICWNMHYLNKMRQSRWTKVWDKYLLQLLLRPVTGRSSLTGTQRVFHEGSHCCRKKFMVAFVGFPLSTWSNYNNKW